MLYEKRQPNEFRVLCLTKHLLARSRINVITHRGNFQIALGMIQPELQSANMSRSTQN